MTGIRPTIDLQPETYGHWRTSDVGAITERLERGVILDMLGDVSGRRVLDVGCGDGDLAVDLSRRGALVDGIDTAPSMIEAARQRASEQRSTARFQVASAQNLPFAAEQFDLVVAVTILCFVQDAPPVLAEIARVLRPGGRLVIGELGTWSSWAAMRRVRGWLGSPLWRKAKFRTARELRALAGGAGLVAGPVRGAIYYPHCGLGARLIGPFDSRVSRMTNFGAAFLAMAAAKPIPLVTAQG